MKDFMVLERQSRQNVFVLKIRELT